MTLGHFLVKFGINISIKLEIGEVDLKTILKKMVKVPPCAFVNMTT